MARKLIRWTKEGGSRSIPDRVAEKAAKAYVIGPAGCWISTYSTASHGYAQIGWNGDGGRFGTTAHRAAWTYANGPIPAGMTVDHICHVRPCVNPRHLRLLPNTANAADNGMGYFKTRVPSGRLCKRGLHEMVTDSQGRTSCRECATERRRQRRQREEDPQ